MGSTDAPEGRPDLFHNGLWPELIFGLDRDGMDVAVLVTHEPKISEQNVDSRG